MKKNISKIIAQSEKKIKEQVKKIKELKFASVKEDFVITKQEEKEGGFFGNAYTKALAI